MNTLLSKLLDDLLHVNSYSLDTTLNELNPDPEQRTLPLGEDEFFSSLYEPREASNLLVKKITSRDQNLLCLVGPKGSGKTTLGRRVIRELSAGGTFVAYVDIRILRSNRVVAEKEEGPSTLLFRWLRDLYFSELFPTPARNDKSVDLLWEFLLDGQANSRKPRELFVVLQEFEAEAHELAETWKSISADRSKKSVGDWIRATKYRELTTQDLLRRLRKEVSFPQLLHASRHVYDLTRHLVWVDNIDGLTDADQSAVAHSLADLNRLISDYAATVVALRESNVFREDDLEDGAPPQTRRILLEAPRSAGGRVVYPSVDVPVISSKLLRSIIEKRVRFANACLPTRRPTLSERMLADLLAISGRLSSVVERDRGIYLANNSIRDLLRIHRDVLAFVLHSEPDTDWPPAAQKYEDWYLSTLFFMWVSNTRRQYNFSLYNVCSLKESWKRNGRRGVGLFLPKVIMTCIWNFVRERKGREMKNSLPTVKEVVDRVAILGFTDLDVREGIISLHRDEFGQRFHLVEIRSPRIIGSAADLHEDDCLYLTYRAKALVSYTSNSFGYFYGCCRAIKETAEDVLQSHPKIDMKRFFEDSGYAHLEELVEMYLWALKRVSERLGVDRNWHGQYRQWFGVPFERPYARNTDSDQNALAIELMFASLISHCNQHMDVSRLMEIESRFHSRLEAIRRPD